LLLLLLLLFRFDSVRKLLDTPLYDHETRTENILNVFKKKEMNYLENTWTKNNLDKV
jgi:hypothetical protein